MALLHRLRFIARGLLPSLMAMMIVTAPITYADETPVAKAANPKAEAPNQFRNIYKAKAYGFSITVTHELSQTDEGYKLRFFADSMLASIEEISEFTWPVDDSEQLRPLHYRYERTGLGRDRQADLQFDWDTHKVTNNIDNKPWKMKITPGVVDKLSFQIQLQHDLIAGKTSLEYNIADGGKIKQYQFAILGEEELDTPLGKIKAVKIKRSRKDSDRVTYAWMAPAYNYLLVRMQQEEGGDVYTIYIHEAEVNGQKITAFN